MTVGLDEAGWMITTMETLRECATRIIRDAEGVCVCVRGQGHAAMSIGDYHHLAPLVCPIHLDNHTAVSLPPSLSGCVFASIDSNCLSLSVVLCPSPSFVLL